MLGSSAKGLERAAASRTMQSSPACLLFYRGLSLQSRRTEEWPPVASPSLLRQAWVSIVTKSMSDQHLTQHNHKSTDIAQELHWSLLLRLVFSFLAVNRRKDSFLPSRPSALKIVRFLLSPRLAMVLDPSSPPPSRHSWPYVEGGGWENQSPQIASHSM